MTLDQMVRFRSLIRTPKKKKRKCLKCGGVFFSHLSLCYDCREENAKMGTRAESTSIFSKVN